MPVNQFVSRWQDAVRDPEMPIATTDGYTIEQHHTGLLYWDTRERNFAWPVRLANFEVAALPDPATAGAGAVA